MTDEVTRPATVRTGSARFAVDERTIGTFPDAAIPAAGPRFDAWSNGGMVRPLRLSFKPDLGSPVGYGTPFGEETALDSVRVVSAPRPGDPWRHGVVTLYPSLDGGLSGRFTALDDFIGAYFHRDWHKAGMSPSDVLKHFSASARRDEIEALAADVSALLAHDDESIAACLVGLDCNYDPAEDHSTDRSWLEWIVRQIGLVAAVLTPPESAVVGEAGWQRASRPIRDASPRAAVVRFVMQYGVAEGRASRSEFWWARVLWGLVVVGFVAAVGAVPIEARAPIMIGLFVWLAATAIPNVTLQARRLHDTDRSGWAMLVHLVPIVGPFVLLWWNVEDSVRSGGRFDRPHEADAEQRERPPTPG